MNSHETDISKILGPRIPACLTPSDQNDSPYILEFDDVELILVLPAWSLHETEC